ncbi:MAG: hypothetical protein KC586_26560 [Myxococcales bacterium]|nr:hypothetical protein [Myxococcales bacterium]
MKRSLLPLLGLLLACDAPAPSAPLEPVDLPAAAPAQAPAAEAPADPLAPLHEADNPAAREAAARLQGLAQLLSETVQSARDAAAGAQGTCAAAYASNVAAQRTSARLAAEHQIPIPAWEVLPEAEYLATCASLPAPLAECARYDRRIDDREGCEGHVRGVADDVRARYLTLVPPRR